MNRTEFEGMCEVFGDGGLVWVENMQTHMKGRVISCEAEMIEVVTDDHTERWDRNECAEVTHGFKVKYEEVKKHPHEYDTHLD